MNNSMVYKKPKKKLTAGKVVWEIVFFSIIACSLIPVLWGFLLSLKTNQEIMHSPFSLPEVLHWENYQLAAVKVPYLNMLKNTAIIMAIALPVSVMIIIMASFALSRMKVGRGRMQGLLYKYFIAGVILPGYIMLFPIYRMSVEMQVYDTLWALILPALGSGASIGIMTISTSMRAIPRELDEAAIVDGCGLMRLLWQIVVPVVMPAIATVTILNFLAIWNNFVMARVLINSEENRVISQAVLYFKGEYSTDYGLTLAGTMILIVPQLIVFTFLQKYVVSGVTSGAIKG